MSLEFHCPHLNRNIKEKECLDIFHKKPDNLCKTCTTFEKQCATWLYEKLSKKLGEGVNMCLTDENDNHLVEIKISDVITLTASIHGLDEGTGFVRIDCNVLGACMLVLPVEDLVDLIKNIVNDKMIIVSKTSLNSLRPAITLFERELIETQPTKVLKGFNVHVIDKNGILTKKEYLAKNDTGEIK